MYIYILVAELHEAVINGTEAHSFTRDHAQVLALMFMQTSSKM
jgi:hypothetical protein